MKVSYKYYYVYDIAADCWKPEQPESDEAAVASPTLQGICRDEINYGWRTMIDIMRRHKINFLCLKKYGDLTEKELKERFSESGIYIYYAK